MLGANLSEKKGRKKKAGALAPSSVRRVCTAFESLSPAHSRAAPKSLCCSYCLCCREYFMRIFQYLFFYFCSCRCLTRPLISYILMHGASRKRICPPPQPPPKKTPVQVSSINHCGLCTSAKSQQRFDFTLAWKREEF